MSLPTPEQIAALKRARIEINKLFTYTQTFNALLDQHGLEAELGIVRLPFFPLGTTNGKIEETLRRYELIESQKARAA